MTVYASTPKGVLTPLLTTATTGAGTAVTVPISSNQIHVNVRGAGTISSGVVTIEEASDPGYTGTWSVLYTVTGTTLSGGAEQVIHIIGTFNAIRARVSTTIAGGGTVSADMVSN